jgi:cold shock CspA family protein
MAPLAGKQCASDRIAAQSAGRTVAEGSMTEQRVGVVIGHVHNVACFIDDGGGRRNVYVHKEHCPDQVLPPIGSRVRFTPEFSRKGPRGVELKVLPG